VTATRLEETLRRGPGDVVGKNGAGVGRSTAVVLFTDLVGSTELRSRLGEDAAELVRRQHDGLVTGAIEVNRGRLVKRLGDGAMATFTGASDALAAAVAIQQALDRRNRTDSGGAALAVRVGVSAGDVAFEETDCFGIPVIEAARLCAAAAGGQILVTQVVVLLAGTGGGWEIQPVGPLDLKGLPAPVPACEVAWEPLPEPAVPLPPLLTDIERIFVAREEELARLDQLWREAAAGQRRVALLAGEPGVGKTRLAAELARKVHDQGSAVLVGRCDEDMGVPYQPFVEALRHAVEHMATAELRDRLGRYPGELVRLLPELSQRLTDLPPPLRSDPETERYRLFDAVAAWLAAASASEPVLLVLDDLQWAAKPTLLLLRHVVRFPGIERLLILGTYRDTELGRDHPLVEVVADLRRQSGVERLSLRGLDCSGVAALMESAAGHSLGAEDRAMARAIHEETEGNPFFVHEVIRHLAETAAGAGRQGRLPAEEFGIPEGVRDVVGRRVARLSEQANRILRVAAVMGVEFDLPVLQGAGDFDEEDLVSALEEATEAHLVTEAPGRGGRYRFAHALVRDTLYGALVGVRRATLHRRVAEAIEVVHGGRLDDHLPALAHHYARSAGLAADTTKAVSYAAQAAERAVRQHAHDEAVTYYRQALDFLPPAPGADEARRLELLISLGEAQRCAGHDDYRQTLLDAARLAKERGDSHLLARAALANTRGMYISAIGAVDVDRVEVLESALDATEPDDSPTRAALLGALALELTYAKCRERRLALSDEALAIARRLGDPATLVSVLARRHYTLGAPDTLSERLAQSAELLALTERLGDPMSIGWAWWLRTRAAMETGDAEETRRALGRVEAIAAELGQPTLRWFAAVIRATYLTATGRLQEAERVVTESAQLAGSTGQPDGPLFLALQLFFIRFEQGRLGEVEDLWVAARARNPEWATLGAALGFLYCELDRDDEARTLFEPLANRDFTDIPFDVVWLPTMAVLGDIAAHLGDTARAAILYDLLAPYAGVMVGATSAWFGSVAHHLGMLAAATGRFHEAERHLGAAAASHARFGAPTWLARTHLEWARMLLTRREPGDAERAGELLAQALATAGEFGLANVERRALALLQL
jgi:class 3 adenylate cyclase/tetratricopeptide (TPR) repeat protein